MNKYNKNKSVFLPSSSNDINYNNYLNISAEHTGVSFYPHQVERAGSIPASATMNVKL